MRIDNNFDGVRLLAALAVVTSHQFLIAGHAEPRPCATLTLGGLAVLVFFSISGFLVASSWMADPKLWRFALRRFLRIWPAYVVVVIGAASWFAFCDPRALASTAAWMFVAKHLLFQPFDWDFFNTLRDPRLNPSIWTIPFEVSCYIAFAAVAALLRNAWPAIACACGLAFMGWAGGRSAFDPSAATAGVDSVLFGAFFALGAALRGLPALRGVRASVALALAGVVAFALGSQVIGLALVVPAAAIFAGTRSWPVLRRAGRFGDLSYGIYLWGWPVQQMLATWLGPHADVAKLLVLSLAGTASIAVLSWHLVERRALAAKPGSRAVWPRALTLVLR